jgi:hypothetical protein
MTGGGRSPDLVTSPFEAGWVSALHSTDDQLDTLLMPNREKGSPMTTTPNDIPHAPGSPASDALERVQETGASLAQASVNLETALWENTAAVQATRDAEEALRRAQDAHARADHEFHEAAYTYARTVEASMQARKETTGE